MPRPKGFQNKTTQSPSQHVVTEPQDEATTLHTPIQPINDHLVHDALEDPNLLHSRLLKEHNLELTFDVLEGTVTTQHGIIQLEKPTLVVKAVYVTKR